MHKSPEGYPPVAQQLCRRRLTAIAKVFQTSLERRPSAMPKSSTMQKSSRSFQPSSWRYAQIARVCFKGRPKVMQLTCDVVPPWATESIAMPRGEHHNARRGRSQVRIIIQGKPGASTMCFPGSVGKRRGVLGS